MNKPIHTYLDLDVVNNNMTSSTNAPQLRFEENRNTPFLEGDSGEYFCSIVRFSIQTGNSLPIFIPRVETGQSDINKTVYRVTLVVDVTHLDAVKAVDAVAAIPAVGNTPAVPAVAAKAAIPATTNSFPARTISLYFSSPDSVADTPQQPTDQQDLTGTYYYQYNIKDVVKMFNDGLTAAWTSFKAQVFPSPEPLDLSIRIGRMYPPFFQYDYDKCRLVLNVDQTFVAGKYDNASARCSSTPAFTSY